MRLAFGKDLSWFDRWIVFASLLFLVSEILSGVIRYTLVPAGLTALIYAPKALLVLMLLIALLVTLARGKISRVYLGTLIGLSSSIIVGLIYVGSLVQVLFGLWILVPLLFGIVAYPTFQRTWPYLKPYIIFLWLLAVLGVLLNWRYTFPWVGFDYTLGGINIEGTLKWTTLGIRRLAGLSRRSAETANQILLLSTFIIALSRGWSWRILMWVVAGLAIFLTTTKTDVGVYAVLTTFLICRQFLPKIFWKFVTAFIALIGIIIPFSTLFIDYSLNVNGFIPRLFFLSFADRLTNIWPLMFKLIAEHGNTILGRGLGGIGTPQKYFEPGLFNPADNLYLYLYALIGIGMFIIVIGYVYSATTLNFKHNKLDMFFCMIVLAVLLLGMTTNVLEAPSVAFFGGLSARHLAPRLRVLGRQRPPVTELIHRQQPNFK